uniref:Dolichyl-P-Glc:Glc(2)Man(9)GlcNAc(2)-PP-dolichol alpha-1,2-glucosyltransferase n=1 Tax=Macrostomum lignano TaxID=282301 RepID=A0A1I8FLU7_9PLAT
PGFEGGTTFGAFGLQDCVGSRCVPLSRRLLLAACEGFMYTKSLIVVKFRHYCLLSILAPAAILVPWLIRSDARWIQYRPNLEGQQRHSGGASRRDHLLAVRPERHLLLGLPRPGPVYVCAVNLAIFVAILRQNCPGGICRSRRRWWRLQNGYIER